jgi:thymidylate kinase
MKTYGHHRFPGRLFIVEGIDGSGKSTQLALLQKWLESEGYGTFFSEWNSSALVWEVTRRGKKKRTLMGARKSRIHRWVDLNAMAKASRRLQPATCTTASWAYQARLLKAFDRMTDEYGFHVVDSSASIQAVSDQIKDILEPMLVPVCASA